MPFRAFSNRTTSAGWFPAEDLKSQWWFSRSLDPARAALAGAAAGSAVAAGALTDAASATIAFDAATDGGHVTGVQTSHTFAHTCTGSNRVLLVGVTGGLYTEGDVVTGATFDGVAMTLLGKRTPGATGTDGHAWLYLFALLNPAVGTHDVVISASAAIGIYGGAVSYTGVKQSGLPDASVIGSVNGSTATLTLTLTTSAINCWPVALMGGDGAALSVMTAGAGTTRRTFDSFAGYWALFDTNAAVTPAGSVSLVGTYASAGTSGMNGVMVSLAPAGVGGSGALAGDVVVTAVATGDIPSAAGAAIAFDAATDGGNNGGTTSSLTFAHTCTGTDRLLLVGVKGGKFADGDLITGATYGGVSMTLIDKRSPGAFSDDEGERWVYLFGLVNPASGANNIVVTASATVFILPGAVSYTGVKQTGLPDAQVVGSVGGATNVLALTLSTTTNNCWAVAVMGTYAAGTKGIAGDAGTTRRSFDATYGTWSFFDTNGIVSPAGSRTLTGEWPFGNVNHGINGVMASFAPVSSVPVAAALAGSVAATAAASGDLSTGLIAFDAVTDGLRTNSGTSLTFAHTCTGSNRVLFVGVKGAFSAGGDVITGATYNGVAMTLIAKRTPGTAGSDGSRWVYLFALLAPATGANNVVVSASTTTGITAGAISYTGVKQSGLPDASVVGSVFDLAHSLTLTLTTVADKSWAVAIMGGHSDNGDTGLAAGAAGTRMRLQNTIAPGGTLQDHYWGLFDTNGLVTPAGSVSLTATYPDNSNWDGINGVMASFAPAVPDTALVANVTGSGVASGDLTAGRLGGARSIFAFWLGGAAAVTATAAALVGNAAGSGAASASLTTAIPLAGSATGTGAASASLTTGTGIAGVAAGSGVTTGALTTAIALAAAAAASGATSASLTGTSAPLAGSASASGATTGALTTVIALAASVSSSGATTGALTTAKALAAAAAASGLTTGTITTAITIVGSVAASAATTGGITTAITIVASVTASGAASATLGSTAAPLASSVAASGVCAGSLTTAIVLVASVSASGAASANISGTAAPLAASATGTGATTGALTTAIALAGTAAGSGATTAALTTGKALAAAATGTAATTGAITTALALAGAAAGAVAASASLTTGIALAGASSGSALTAGILTSTAVSFAGTAAASGAASASLTTAIKLVGSSTGSGFTSATMAGTPAVLAASVSASATVTGAITTTLVLAAAPIATGSTFAYLSSALTLASSATGSASTSGDLTTGIGLRAAAAASGATTADLLALMSISGAAMAAASASGTLTTGVGLAGSATGSATSSGDLTTAIALAADALGTGSASATTLSGAPPVCIDFSTAVCRSADFTVEVVQGIAVAVAAIAPSGLDVSVMLVRGLDVQTALDTEMDVQAVIAGIFCASAR